MNWLKDKIKQAKRAVKRKASDTVNKNLDKRYCIKPRAIKLTSEQRDKLEKKRALYLRRGAIMQSRYGSHESTFHCDSLLFDALGKIGGQSVSLYKFRSGKKWFRTQSHDCFKDGRSKSTVSRDMLKGVILAAYWYKEKKLLQDTVDHLRSADWMAGDAVDKATKMGRCFVTPSLRADMCEALYRLGGSDLPLIRSTPVCVSKNQTNYKQHLEALTILTSDIVRGGITEQMRDAIEHYDTEYSLNALWNYLYERYIFGGGNETYDLLMNEAFWPNDKLPTSHDRKAKWLFERDYNEYKGDTLAPKQVYPGTDFCFVASLLLRQ